MTHIDYYLSRHARKRMIEYRIPERIAELLFTDAALRVLTWPRTYQRLTRQQLASKEYVTLSIIKEPSPTKLWWLAYEVDNVIITVVRQSHKRALKNISNRLVNTSERLYIKRNVPVIDYNEVEPRIASSERLREVLAWRTDYYDRKDYSTDELIF